MKGSRGFLTLASSALGRSLPVKHCGRQERLCYVSLGRRPLACIWYHTRLASYPGLVSTRWRWQDQHQGALLYQGTFLCQPTSAQFLPWHSHRSLARQGCPGLPFLPSPGGRLGWPSGPGHSLHRCSVGGNGKDGGSRVRDGQGKPPGGCPHGIQGPGTLPNSPSPSPLPPQPHPCGSFALSSGDPIPAIGSEFPPGRGSGRAKPERFPDRRVGGGGGTRRGTICPGCYCNLHPWRGQDPRIQDEEADSQRQHLCLGMPGASLRRSRPPVDTPVAGLPAAHQLSEAPQVPGPELSFQERLPLTQALPFFGHRLLRD